MASVSFTTITELEPVPVLQHSIVGGDWVPDSGLEEYVGPICPDGPVAWFSASAEVEFFALWRPVYMDRVE